MGIVKKSISYSYEVMTGCGLLDTSFKYNEDKIRVSMSMGKAGGCASSQIDAIERLLNLMLDNSVPIEEIQKCLSGICCHIPYQKVLSCADGISKILDEISSIHENRNYKGETIDD